MDLNNILDYQNSMFTLIQSNNTDGSFLIHYLLSNSIRQSSTNENLKTIFIHFSQTLSHFKSVQAKLGNLNQFNNCINNEKFINFDLMTDLSGKLFEQSIVESNNLNPIISKIESIISNPDLKLNVIIDDLSIATLIGFSDNILLNFLTKIQSLSNKINLILSIQSFYSNKYFINDLVYMSDYYLKVENLSTGYLKEINGQLKIYKQPKIISIQKEEKYLFKINERNVQLFPV